MTKIATDLLTNIKKNKILISDHYNIIKLLGRIERLAIKYYSLGLDLDVLD